MKRFLFGFVAALAVAGGTLLAIAQPAIISGTETRFNRSIFQVAILRITRDESLTAFAGGGQTGALQLVYGMNRITTVGTAADSVKLPTCAGGKVVVVINAAAANSMNVYGQSGETINALSANSAFAIAANKMVIFACANDGAWYSLTTA